MHRSITVAAAIMALASAADANCLASAQLATMLKTVDAECPTYRLTPAGRSAMESAMRTVRDDKDATQCLKEGKAEMLRGFAGTNDSVRAKREGPAAIMRALCWYNEIMLNGAATMVGQQAWVEGSRP